MFKSLYAKLALALLVLFLVIGICFLVIVRFSTDLYYKEITQKLNSEIASYTVAAQQLMEGGEINREQLEELAKHVMMINPSAEVYLLDRQGNILGYSADPSKIKRNRVDTSPIHRALRAGSNGAGPSLIMGDDPRSLDGKKIFSVAEVIEGGQLQGYLYVILGGEKFDSIVHMIEGSYILKQTAWAIVASIVFAFSAGLFIFAALTRRLRNLTEAVEQFRREQVSDDQKSAHEAPATDEIDRLAIAFKEMSARIKDQVEALKETDRLRRELVTNVSHDLRTPLASMQGYIETILIKGERLTPEEQKEYLEIAHKHGKQLGRLVEELFELARLDARNIEPRMEAFSLAELMQDVVQKFELAAKSSDVTLRSRISPDAPFVHADICLIERVLENLIENALRYTPRGGNVDVNLERTADRLEVSVSDNGCGIPPEHLPYIFDRFYRADPRKSEHPDRTGLGLAIVKRILELHSAQIHVQSEVDAGTAFTFELPVSRKAA